MPKSFALLSGAAAVALCAVSFPASCLADAAADDAIAQIVTEIAAQHVKIAANQQAITQKLATIEENLRVARIYVSRGGGKK